MGHKREEKRKNEIIFDVQAGALETRSKAKAKK